MSLKGPIILIEDDLHDIDVIKSALLENETGHEIRCFTGAKSAMDYLMSTQDQPFIILCDIMMQGMNGLEFRNAINQNDFLRKKSIPFVFFTAAVSQQIVDEAYDLTVQGFFKKPSNFNDLKARLSAVVTYWSNSLHPNSF